MFISKGLGPNTLVYQNCYQLNNVNIYIPFTEVMNALYLTIFTNQPFYLNIQKCCMNTVIQLSKTIE